MNAPTKIEEMRALEQLALNLGIDLSFGQERQRRLGYLASALISRPWADIHRLSSNAKDEWVGDRIWSLAIIEEVLQRYPRVDIYTLEGWRYALASGEEQYYNAVRLGIHRSVKIPKGYTPSERTHKFETERVIIGNALEAILGAIARWSVRAAVKCGRQLIQLRMRTRTYVKIRDVIAGGDDRPLDISNPLQLFGFNRLAVFVTRELVRIPNLKLSKAHAIRQEILGTPGLARLAHAARAAKNRDKDVEAMQQLLTRTGSGRKLDQQVKDALHQAVQAGADKLDEPLRRRIHTVETGPHSAALGQLKALTEAHRMSLEFIGRPRGGGMSRTVAAICHVNGKKVAEAEGKTLDEAKEKAALATLVSPLFEKLLSEH